MSSTCFLKLRVKCACTLLGELNFFIIIPKVSSKNVRQNIVYARHSFRITKKHFMKVCEGGEELTIDLFVSEKNIHKVIR